MANACSAEYCETCRRKAEREAAERAEVQPESRRARRRRLAAEKESGS